MTTAVLVVEDDGGLREALRDTLDMSGFSVVCASSAENALDRLQNEEFGLVVSDIQMGAMDGMRFMETVKSLKPDLPVLLMTAFASIEQAVAAMRAGAADYLVKPFEAQVLVSKVSTFLKQAESLNAEFVAHAEASLQLKALAQKVSASDVTVLITGESGTGKEVLARYIHECSPRAQQPFVAINCAAIPDNMLEAVLFGYEKGAFTGAHKSSPGKFEQAQNGTLLLDEISEMALGLQAKLLRVLQEREVERLGAKQTVALNVRVLATSNRDMRGLVGAGDFREDLYYRLNVFPLDISPLRERREDIIPVATKLLSRAAGDQHRNVPALSASAVSLLCEHTWPGNVRELDNTLQRALVLESGDVIGPQSLIIERAQQLVDTTASQGKVPPSLGDELKNQEFRMILDSLQDEGGNRSRVAEKLGISPRTLRHKMALMRDAGWAVPTSR